MGNAERLITVLMFLREARRSEVTQQFFFFYQGDFYRASIHFAPLAFMLKLVLGARLAGASTETDGVPLSVDATIPLNSAGSHAAFVANKSCQMLPGAVLPVR